ncbi:hypothetical protein ABZ942_15680 [Nocardia sp. NPDC046473]|uniref:hypothetical protein n=1 Tax=Nocardia sp. NPDC046473 TaxID=3155733 RepID=UPI0033C8A32B
MTLIASAAGVVALAPATYAAEKWKYTCDAWVATGNEYTGKEKCVAENGAPKTGEIKKEFDLYVTGTGLIASCRSGKASLPGKIVGKSCEGPGDEI